MDLHIDYVDHSAVKYACEKWHYSKSVPPPPHVRFGVWEDDQFIGVVLYARGASCNLLKPYGLEQTEGAELVRVALNKHETTVTRIISITIKMLRRQCPGLRLIVSFADPAQGHEGKIYQAGNWIYAGKTPPSNMYRDDKGKLWHERMISKRGWNLVYGQKRKVLKPSDCEKIRMPGKHRYLMPLDSEMREQIELMRCDYPTS